jgi:hypothetical protein
MTKEQSELFDFSMDLGFTRETREGIERAARNANEVWTNYAKHAFVFMAVGRMFFTSADVDVYMMEHFPQIKTHEKRAMGQVTLWAMKNKVVRLTDRFTRDPRPNCHQKPCRVLESLLRK